MRLLSGIRRNVLLLGLASFFTDVSSEMILPTLPVFLAVFLGVGKEVIGLIEGVANSLSSLLDIFFGHWSDSGSKRKPFVVAGYGLSSLSKAGTALSASWLPLALFRWTDRLGKSIRSAPRDAIIAASSDKSVRGKAFGLHRAMDTLGAVVGPTIAILLLYSLGEKASTYRAIFATAVLPAFIAVAIIYFFVREPEKAAMENKKEEKQLGFWQKIRQLSSRFKRFLAISCLFSLSYFSFAFLILRASEIGLKTESVLLAYILFNIVYAVFSIPAGSLSDKIGRKKVIAGSFILYAIVSLGFAFAASILHVAVFFALYGVFVAAYESVAKAHVSDLSDEKHRGLALGAYKTATGAVLLPSSLIFGGIWAAFGAAAAFIGAALVALAAGIAMMAYAK